MYPQGLDQMFFGPIGGDFAVQQFGQAMQKDQLSNQKSLQDMLFAQQEQPLKMDQMRANTRNINASADEGELKNKFTRDTWDDKMKSEVSKFAREVDENQLKQINARLERDMMSPDPKVRADAQQTYQFTKEMMKFKEEEGLKHKNKLGEIAAQGHQARLTQQQAADLGKWKPKGGSGSGGSIEDIVAKQGFEKAAVTFHLKSQEALRKGNTEEAQYWGNLADQMKQSWERGKILAGQQGQAGRVDTGAVAGVPTMPGPAPQGFTPQSHGGQVGPPTQNPAAQQPQQGNYVVGQSYTGKTGTYKYLGGDPKNKASWQKVN